MSSTKNPDVVIVGAGPVGLVAACDLARRGVGVRIVDKLAAPTNESRAIAIHARSCDMLDRMGVLDDLIATGVKSTAMNMFANGEEDVPRRRWTPWTARLPTPSSPPRPRPSAC